MVLEVEATDPRLPKAPRRSSPHDRAPSRPVGHGLVDDYAVCDDPAASPLSFSSENGQSPKLRLTFRPCTDTGRTRRPIRSPVVAPHGPARRPRAGTPCAFGVGTNGSTSATRSYPTRGRCSK